MSELANMTLTSLELEDFRNIKSAKFDIDNIIALVGANNSGKSNWFKLFELFSKLYYGGRREQHEIFSILGMPSRRGEEKTTKVKIGYSVVYKKATYQVTYELELMVKFDKKASFQILTEELRSKMASSPGKPRVIVSRKGTTVKFGNSEKLKAVEVTQLFFATMRALYPSYDDIPSDLKVAYCLPALADVRVFSPHDKSANYYMDIADVLPRLSKLKSKNAPAFRDIAFYLKKILDIDDIVIERFTPGGDVGPASSESVEQRDFYFCFLEKNKQAREISSFSDGTKILLLVLYEMFASRSPLICIDEPEVGLHPQALAALMDIVLKRTVNKQTVIATHSPFLLNLIHHKNIRVTEMDANGETEFVLPASLMDLESKLKSKYVNFGDLFVMNFQDDEIRLD